MNRASDREARLVVLESQMHEVLSHLEALTGSHRELRKEINLMRELQAHMARAILKINREITTRQE